MKAPSFPAFIVTVIPMVLRLAVSLCWSIPLSIASTVVPFLIDCARARHGAFEKEEALVLPLAPPLCSPHNLFISVVIPAYYEMGAALATLRRAAASLQSTLRVEFIVAAVDDSTTQELQFCEVPLTVIRTESGRASALNAGAKAAKGDVLLFLHADSTLPRYWDWEVRAAVCREGSPLCAFQFDVGNDDGDNAEEGTSMEGLGMVKFLTNLRASFLMLPYGDQALFISTERFRRMGGFCDMPMMEDYEFVTRVRRACLRASFRTGSPCAVSILPVAVKCSARRWQRKGVAWTTAMNQFFVILYVYWLASPTFIYQWYYGRKVAETPQSKIQ